MKKTIVVIVGIGIVLMAGFYWLNSYIYTEKQADVSFDPRNASYVIDGSPVQLVDGYAQSEAAPGAASQVVTRYFGNELRTDLDGDGREDVAFILTQERGGSGTYFYAVGALTTSEGLRTTEAYLLGDRIAPQPTSLSNNPRHVRVVTFNFADRAPGEPMTAQPSVGKSVYLKLDPESLRWAIVEPDFEGESM